MKIKEGHYKELKEAIENVLSKHPNTYKEYKKLGLTDIRFRWDVLWYSKYDYNKLYEYLNDNHIDTALKKITGTK